MLDIEGIAVAWENACLYTEGSGHHKDWLVVLVVGAYFMTTIIGTRKNRNATYVTRQSIRQPRIEAREQLRLVE